MDTIFTDVVKEAIAAAFPLAQQEAVNLLTALENFFQAHFAAQQEQQNDGK